MTAPLNNAGDSDRPRSLKQFDLARPREIQRLTARAASLTRWLAVLAGTLLMGGVLVGILSYLSFGISVSAAVLLVWCLLFLLPAVWMESWRANTRHRIKGLSAEHKALLNRTGEALDDQDRSDDLPAKSS
jgi:hypothetical protein